jgi:hypothetical protein
VKSMAINPQIPLMARPQIDPTPGLGQLANAIQYTQQRDAKAAEAKKANELRDLQIQKVKSDLAEKGQFLPVKQTIIDSALVMPLLTSGKIPEAIQMVDSRIQFLEDNDLDSTHSRQFRRLLETAPEEAFGIAQKNIQLGGMLNILDLSGGEGTDVAQKTDIINGEIAAGIDDSGQTFAIEIATNKRLEGPEAQQKIQQAMQAERKSELKAKKDALDAEVTATGQKERIKKREARVSELTAEINEGARNAAGRRPIVREALIVAQSATQGLQGVSKQALARIFPGIDVSNEAVLESNLLRLALEQLQAFKGPTTDFEFNKAQGIGGEIADPASANIARLKAVERAIWFAEEEKRQFDEFVKGDNDPEQFVFRMDVPAIVRGQGLTHDGKPVTLQDLQDTASAKHISIEQVIQGLR